MTTGWDAYWAAQQADIAYRRANDRSHYAVTNSPVPDPRIAHLRRAHANLHHAEECKGMQRDMFLSVAADELEAAGCRDMAVIAERAMQEVGGDGAELRKLADGIREMVR